MLLLCHNRPPEGDHSVISIQTQFGVTVYKNSRVSFSVPERKQILSHHYGSKAWKGDTTFHPSQWRKNYNKVVVFGKFAA